MIFTVLDRYGNKIIKNDASGIPVALDFQGTLQRNADTPIDISFPG